MFYMTNRHSNSLVIAILLTYSAYFTSALLPDLPHFFPPNISAIPPGFLPNGTKPPWDAFKNFTGSCPGMRHQGLSKMKKYFQNFGYIDSLMFNFTDDFDDTLTSAIKTYQKNFNLNATGELDVPTLEMIVRPRCGNQDIINGTSTMHSGRKLSSHFHITGHYSFFPNTPRWPKKRYALKYAFLAENQLSDTVKQVFARAFTRWSQVTPLTFTETSSYTTADIRIAFFSGDHGDGEPFDGVLGTLAHAFSPTNGRFHLDAAESWIVEGDITKSTLATAIDLESVAVHEIGHLLGLGHSSVEDAIMFPTITAGTRRVELATDDVDGIQFLYGSNPNFNGSVPTTAPVSSQDNSFANRMLFSYLSGWGFLFCLFALHIILYSDFI